jgi:hypothetical protein
MSYLIPVTLCESIDLGYQYITSSTGFYLNNQDINMIMNHCINVDPQTVLPLYLFDTNIDNGCKFMFENCFVSLHRLEGDS